MLRTVVIAAIAITVTTPNIGHFQNSTNDGQKAVLVTGASTGIGRKLTERLAAHGYFVYATARKETDLQALATIKNVQGVRLDVTHPDEIAAAVETVTKGGLAQRKSGARGRGNSGFTENLLNVFIAGSLGDSGLTPVSPAVSIRHRLWLERVGPPWPTRAGGLQEDSSTQWNLAEARVIFLGRRWRRFESCQPDQNFKGLSNGYRETRGHYT